MYRKIQEKLKEWKESPYRKPLILQGARQVGKTYSILEFGRLNYDNIVYLNFETNHKQREIFQDNLEPSYLIPIIERNTGKSIAKGRTLLFMDEVQLCERALTSLKYFNEQAPEYHIIVAGSLLGVALNREVFSFPVGQVDMLMMYPMDIEEFFLALGEDGLVAQIKEAFVSNKPLPSVIHEACIKIYKKYLCVGGMPEAVSKYIETNDYILVRHVQDTILVGYLNDMSKYNQKNEIRKVHLTYDNITIQLSKKNTQFQYKLIKKGARASEFENAIEWLCLSGVISQVYKVEHPQKPLINYKDINSFKIYMSDMGLLCAKNKLSAEDVLYMEEISNSPCNINDFKGGMTENYVYLQLKIKGYDAYYWVSKRGSAEIDFIVQLGRDVIPLEVKSADNTRAKSLGIYMKQYSPPYAIKISSKNFGFEDNKKIVPLYAVFCI